MLARTEQPLGRTSYGLGAVTLCNFLSNLGERNFLSTYPSIYLYLSA